MNPGVVLQSISREAQQRTQHAPVQFRHRSRAAYARATQQVVQYGFRLIIGMMGQQNPVGGMIRQRLVAYSPSRRFNTFSSLIGHGHS